MSSRHSNLIFIFWASQNLGGLERRYARLASYIIDAYPEYTVSILTQVRCENALRSFLTKPQQSLVFPFGGGQSETRRGPINVLRELAQLHALLHLCGDAHIHLCINPGLVSLLIALILPLRARLSVAMADTTYDKSSSILTRIAARLSITRICKIDCLSDHPKALLCNLYPPLPLSRLRTAPCSFTCYASVKVADCRDIDLVMMARFVAGKGYELLGDIEDILNIYTLHCYGSGPRPPMISSAYVGYASNPFEVLSRAKVFLSLQCSNNYPSQSVLEAMASGCAIIATDVGETRAFLDDDCAVLIPYDSSRLKMAIESLMRDSSLRESLGRRAKARVFRDHTVQRYAQYFSKEILSKDLS